MLCLLVFYSVQAQNWQPIGADDLVQPSYGETNGGRVVVSSLGSPYIAYTDASRGDKLTVMQFDGVNWIAVGSPGFSSGAAIYINLVFDPSGTLYVAYSDLGLSGKGVVKKFNGTSWTSVGGATFSIGQAQYVSLAINSAGTPYVAIQDMTSANYGAYVKSFNGTSWVSVGSGAATSVEATNLSLAFDASGTPNLAYRIEGVGAQVGKAAVVKLSGTSWINVGIPAFTPGTVDFLSLVADAAGVLHVAYRDDANGNKASVKKYVSGAWTDVGLPGFSPGLANFTGLCFDASSVPYVVFNDAANLNNATVMKFTGGAWGYVGAPGFSDGNAMGTSIAIAAGGTPYVVYSDYSKRGKAFVRKYDGISWTAVGPAASVAENAKTTSLSVDGSGNVYLAYADEMNTSKANVKKYSGGVWATVGQPAFSAGEANYISLAVSSTGTPYVAYQDWANGAKATVKQFDGTSWVNVGTAGFTSNAVSFTSITFDPAGIPFLAFRDQANSNKATVKKFVSGSWIDVGIPGFSSGGAWSTSLAIHASGVPYISYSDLAVSSKAIVRKFDGSSWVDVGTPGVSASSVDFTSLALSPTGTPYVVYSVGGNGVNVKRFDGVNWVNVGPASFITGAEEIALTISNAGVPYLSYRQVSNGKKLSVVRFDGTSWVNVGTAGISGGEIVGTDIVAYNSNIYVAYAAGKKVTNPIPSITGWGAYVKMYTEPLVFSASIATALSSICAGTPTTFTSTVANGGVNPGYQWRVNTSAIAGATTTSFTTSTLATGDLVDCIVTSSDPGNPSIMTNAISMTVNNCAPAITALNPALSFCRGDALTVDFTAAGNYTAGNVFTAQLSNSSGSFASPVTIGTLSSTTSGTINASIPSAQAAGSAYRVRIVSSSPALTGADNGNNLSVAVLPTPAQVSIAVTGSLSICPGGGVDFSVPSNVSLSYQWENGGLPIAGATGTNYTAISSGSYTVEATNAAGCSRTSAIKTVSVSASPVATITPSQHQTLCPGQPFAFQANTGSGLSYQWLSNGNPIAGATNSSYIVNAIGIYAVVVTNAAGCLTTSDTVGLSYNACGASIASISPSPNICRGDGISVSYSAPGSFNAGNVFSAQLSNATGSFSAPVTIGTLANITSGTIAAIIPASQAAGSGYRIRIVSSSPASVGVDNGTNLSILIQPTAAQASITANGPLAICAGGTVGLSVTPVAALSYQWRLGGNNIAGATTNAYTASTAGVYSVTVTNANGCSRTSANKTVTLLSSPAASITPSTTQSLCATGSASFTANTGAGLSYNWLMNGSGISGATNSAYNATVAGSYSVQITNSDGCSAVSSDVSVTANCGAVITDGGLRNVCAGRE
jgi:hypothetical protein